MFGKRVGRNPALAQSRVQNRRVATPTGSRQDFGAEGGRVAGFRNCVVGREPRLQLPRLPHEIAGKGSLLEQVVRFPA